MRIFLAIQTFFKIIFSKDYGKEVLAITDGSTEKIKEMENQVQTLSTTVNTLKEQLEKSITSSQSITSDLQKIAAAETTAREQVNKTNEKLQAIEQEYRKAKDSQENELDALHKQLEGTLESVALAQTNVNKMLATSANGPAILLSLLQREGRLIDFMMEDIKDFDDDQIGAAIRPVHSGCQKVFKDYVKLIPIEKGVEGDKVKIKEGFDASAIKLTGKVKGTPPFTGTLQHHGWIIDKLNLPSRPETFSAEVISPAEVEIN